MVTIFGGGILTRPPNEYGILFISIGYHGKMVTILLLLNGINLVSKQKDYQSHIQ